MDTAPGHKQYSPRAAHFALAAVALFLLTCLGAEWLAVEWLGRACATVSVIIALVGAWIYGRTGAQKPVHLADVGRAWVAISTTTIFALAIGGWVAWSLGAWHGGDMRVLTQSSDHWFLIKLATVAAQQVVLHLFIVPSLRTRIRQRTLVALTATSIFAALHLPNPLLVVLTWIAGFIWINFYFRFRQLTPLIASHLVLALAVALFAGEYVLKMRVGKSCVELLPQTIQTGAEQIKVLSHAISGHLDCVTQSSGDIVVRGQATDPFHNQGVDRFCLLNSSRQQFIRIDNCEWQTDARHERRYRFEFRIPVSSLVTAESWELYAANVNGWYSRLSPIGAIAPIAAAPKHFTVQLFPKRIDGRFEQLMPKSGDCQVAGWVIDMNDFTIPTRMGICCDGRNWVIPLHAAKNRHDIASAMNLDEPPLCGFDVLVREIDLNGVQRIGFFAVDQDEIWHPLAPTPLVCERVAETWPRIEFPTR